MQLSAPAVLFNAGGLAGNAPLRRARAHDRCRQMWDGENSLVKGSALRHAEMRLRFVVRLLRLL